MISFYSVVVDHQGLVNLFVFYLSFCRKRVVDIYISYIFVSRKEAAAPMLPFIRRGGSFLFYVVGEGSES